MTSTIKTISQHLLRTAIRWLVDALSLAGAAWALPGLSFYSEDGFARSVIITAAALLLALVNLLIRPVILLLARPLGWVVTLVIGFFVNAIAIWLTAWLLPGFDVTFWGGIIGGIVIAFFNAIISGVLEIDEEHSWYQQRIERLAREQPYAGADEPGRGLMMLEIDGLSYWHIHKALDQGLLPTLPRDDRRGRLRTFPCGLRAALHDVGLPGGHYVW